MKRLLIALTAILFLLTSCQKSGVTSSEPITSDETALNDTETIADETETTAAETVSEPTALESFEADIATA